MYFGQFGQPLLSTILSGLYFEINLTAGIWIACARVIDGDSEGCPE
jgi:hypothetical protein